jgi:hypothetical protein
VTRVAGLDVGFSLTRKSSGVAILKEGRLELSRHFGGAAMAPILAAGPFEVIAIDGPIVPAGGDPLVFRGVERLFASGLFQNRCKPASSHVQGTGRALRQATEDGSRRAAVLNFFLEAGMVPTHPAA